MKEYIDREAAIELVKSLIDTMSVCTSIDECLGMKSMKSRALCALHDVPAVDVVEVRHKHWIKLTKVHPDLLNDSTYNYRCSNCGYMDTHGANVEVPYCWHCGAKMDGGAE